MESATGDAAPRGSRRARPPATRATLGSVAERAGVSPQTVSNVLNSPHLVRSDTAERVRAAVRQLGYRPHRAAQQLRTRRSQILGLRVENAPGDGVFDRFLHALTAAATGRDYRIMLYTASDNDAEIASYDELLDRWDVDGFVLTSTHPGDRRTSHLATRQVPCVTFGRPWDDSGHHPWVDVDGAAGTRAATEHLLAAGHRTIGYLGWPAGPGVGDDRESGWRQAQTAAGVPTGPIARADNDLTEGRAAASDLLDRPGLTALVCASDVLGLGAMAELGARGLQAGSDVAVIGFDDTDVAGLAGLASVSQPLGEVADHCIRIITSLLDASAPDSPTEHILLPPELMLRASAAASGPEPGSPPIRPQ